MASDKSKIEQKDIHTGRDFIGGDQTNLSFIQQSKINKYLKLIEHLDEEIKKNSKSSEIIDSLYHYKQRIPNDKWNGLEEKIENSEYNIDIKYALRAKESFTKKLLDYEYYESAQKLFVRLLASIESDFNTLIYPLIQEKINLKEINILFRELIRKQIIDELGDCSLEINDVHVDGMLFFLTGNCFINWE